MNTSANANLFSRLFDGLDDPSKLAIEQLEGSRISNLAARIDDSLIGKNVRIYRLPVKPSAYRFMLGDNSEVGIRW